MKIFNFVTYGAFLLFSEFDPKLDIHQEPQSQKRQLKSSGILLMLACQVSRSTHQLQRNAAVVPVNDLVRPCHLIPKMGQSVDRGWTGGNVYEAANDFYLNAYIDVDMFCISSRIS